MKKALVILAMVMFLFVAFNAAMAAPAEKKSVTVTAVGNGPGNMTGKLGLGTGGRGVGLRYWLTDNVAVDGNFGFSLGKDRDIFGIGGKGVFVLKKTTYLRFLALAGIQIDLNNYEANSYKDDVTDINIGGGLGVEYYFQELPSLSFGAFVTGIGVDISTEDAGFNGNTNSNTVTTFATNPGLGLEIRYYFN